MRCALTSFWDGQTHERTAGDKYSEFRIQFRREHIWRFERHNPRTSCIRVRTCENSAMITTSLGPHMTENTVQKQEEKRSSRFQAGKSGNAAGRPRGARNKTTVALEELLAGEGEALTRRVINMALDGDPIALRLAFERVMPLRRGRPVRFDMPEMKSASDVVSGLSSILRSVSAGDLTPEEASTIATILETKRRALELVDLETRLAAVESRISGPGR